MAAYMYENAPQTKIDGVRRLGGEVRFIPMETWWRYVVDADRPDIAELLISPVTDQAVLSGNGTIGMEIVEDLPEVDCVFTPYGGGSLTTGVASAVKALRPQARIFASEDDLAASLGHLGNPGHEEVQMALRDAVDKLKALGKPAGIFAANPEDAKRCRDWGYRFVAAGVDLGLLVRARTARLRR